MREKKRYITFEVTSSAKVLDADIKKAVEQGLQSFLGTYGCAKAGVMLVENKGKKGIIKVQSKYVDQVKTALSLIKEINKRQVIIKGVRVSGMINKAKTGEVK